MNTSLSTVIGTFGTVCFRANGSKSPGRNARVAFVQRVDFRLYAVLVGVRLLELGRAGSGF